MIFDYRPLITLDPAEAQLNEGGPNQWEACGPSIYALILKWLGNGDPLEPQQITDAIHGVNYHGGEVSAKLIAFFQAHRDKYPHLPPITVVQGGDIVVNARTAGVFDYPTCNWWWSNSNGDIQPGNTGILHWSPIIYDDGANLGVFNIMRGQLVVLPYATARAAYAGEFTTFHASLGGTMELSASALFGLGHLIVSAMYHRPATAEEVNALGLKPDLSNLDTVMQTVENNVVNPQAAVHPFQATALRADLNALGGGKAGPPGPIGPPGPAGVAAPHKHTVTGIAEINT